MELTLFVKQKQESCDYIIHIKESNASEKKEIA